MTDGRFYPRGIRTTALMGILGLGACNVMNGAGDGGADDGMDGPDTARLRLTFAQLRPAGADFDYEGWLIVDGMPVSTGKFDIGDNGAAEPEEFEVSASDADAATAFVVTIEPAMDDPPEPADTHVLAGDWDGEEAELTVGHPAAIGQDFSDAAGSFILAAPTTADDPNDFLQGIWWLRMTMDGPTASLVLPTLPAGWVYEGWVVDPASNPISTGKFEEVDQADSDGPGPAAGPDPAPPFPGQDFVDPATELLSYAAVISVEPDPDNSPEPFVLKPLIDMNIGAEAEGDEQSMMNQAAETNPAGQAVRTEG